MKITPRDFQEGGEVDFLATAYLTDLPVPLHSGVTARLSMRKNGRDYQVYARVYLNSWPSGQVPRCEVILQEGRDLEALGRWMNAFMRKRDHDPDEYSNLS